MINDYVIVAHSSRTSFEKQSLRVLSPHHGWQELEHSKNQGKTRPKKLRHDNFLPHTMIFLWLFCLEDLISKPFSLEEDSKPRIYFVSLCY